MHPINGVDFGEDYIRIYENGKEIVGWHEDEWTEDPDVVFAIANAVKLHYEGRLQKTLKP